MRINYYSLIKYHTLTFTPDTPSSSTTIHDGITTFQTYVWKLPNSAATLRRGSVAARSLELWVWIPPRAWMSVSCECYVLKGRGLCDGLISRPEQSYREGGVWVWLRSLHKEALVPQGLLRHWEGGRRSMKTIITVYFKIVTLRKILVSRYGIRILELQRLKKILSCSHNLIYLF